ncbi:methylated-DNA--[protein]-cysteine S-methyltransferase [Sharpea azabuensis]|uniref:methylated-DNA--[protein]-cysteine S-methyltransferase n=1 Tax=Sharpea porci TaxID=2652286 RepID=A0A844FQ85_9FIRM|nr:methylated-DNA--[protein]-cysteine S-methyltransferase [Sharpea porci]MST88101.1 methylated-DNA--[protein]-cysteine S-methyltransferase [Sharpea porci]
MCDYNYYQTPASFDDLVMVSDGVFLTGLYFTCDPHLDKQAITLSKRDLEIFKMTRAWLDAYFLHHECGQCPPIKIEHATAFQQEVYEILKAIPYGETVTYKDIAKRIAIKRGMTSMSAQAVGQAVGSNPIAIMIGCHRVIGSNGKLNGYRGGLKNKKALLNHEKS